MGFEPTDPVLQRPPAFKAGTLNRSDTLPANSFAVGTRPPQWGMRKPLRWVDPGALIRAWHLHLSPPKQVEEPAGQQRQYVAPGEDHDRTAFWVASGTDSTIVPPLMSTGSDGSELTPFLLTTST